MNYSIQMSNFSSERGCKSFFERLSVAIKQVHMTLHLLAFSYIYIILFLCMLGKSIGNFHIRILITSFPRLLLPIDLTFDEGVIFLAEVKSVTASLATQALRLQMKICFCGEILVFHILEPKKSDKFNQLPFSEHRLPMRRFQAILHWVSF